MVRASERLCSALAARRQAGSELELDSSMAFLARIEFKLSGGAFAIVRRRTRRSHAKKAERNGWRVG